jgi:Trk K+ transport system NAD-binding subunit
MEQEHTGSTPDVLLVGYGTGSRRITGAFKDRGVRFIVFEKDSHVAAEARAEGHAVVEGDASDSAILRAAAVEGVDLVAITIDQRNEEIARAVRTQRPKGVILTTLPAGFAESEDSTTRMIGRMTRILDYVTRS